VSARSALAGLSLLAGLLGSGADARAQGNAPSPPLELKRTVDAFAGHWALTGIDTEPGAQPVQLKLTLDCKRSALGAAASCELAERRPGAAPLEATSVIAYSPEEHVVRWMEVWSRGESHDHHGVWKGDAIVFAPLAYTVAGKPATERLEVEFPSPGELRLRSVTETPAGKSILDCSGKRAGSR